MTTTPGGEESDVRKRLIAAATELWFEHGYLQTPIEKLTSRAGLTKGAFYYYFSSKDQLLEMLHAEFLENGFRIVDRALAESESAREAMEGVMIGFAESIEQYREGVAIFFREFRNLSPETFDRIRVRRDDLERQIVTIVERGIENGEFEPVEHPRLVAFGLMGMINWLYEWFDPQGEINAREVGQLYTRLVMDGLAVHRS